MCGIIGYAGSRNAAPLLLQGLRRLEYRGYDSAGVATLTCEGIAHRRAVGKLVNLEALLEKEPLLGTVGIGHNRWATHGKPTVENAHPHTSCNGRVAVVHNGTIENYIELRKELEAEGCTFSSETDTEVVAHLVERALRTGVPSLEDAVAASLTHLRGAYALAIISAEHPGEIVAARLSSALFIGFGAEGVMLSSDEVGFNGSASEVLALEDGEVATLCADGSRRLRGVSAEDMQARITPPSVSLDDIDKGGYPHLMLKEIDEQPDAIRNVLRGRLGTNSIKLGGVEAIKGRLADSRRIYMVACGTSYHAALFGKRLIEGLVRIPVEVALASEFFHEDVLVDKRDSVIGVSQSGSTFDTLRAIELAKKRKALTFGITNRVGSELAQLTGAGIYLHVGPECAVASTKAFTGQATAFALLALRLAYERGYMQDIQPLIRGLAMLPKWVEQALRTRAQIQSIVASISKAQRAIFIGRGYGVPLALEGALKLKEVAYIDAHGYAAGELKHGPLALVEEGTPVVAVALRSKVHTAMLANMEEAKARGAHVIALATQGDYEVPCVADECIELPDIPEELMAIVGAIPLQLLAYEWGVAKGLDVDQPRNLAKSVTVG